MAARVKVPIMSRQSGFPGEEAKQMPRPFKLRRYYTPSEVSRHNTGDDCWVSFFYCVYDLTKLLADNKATQSELCVPIAKAAGTDISHWFDPETRDVSNHSCANKLSILILFFLITAKEGS